MISNSCPGCEFLCFVDAQITPQQLELIQTFILQGKHDFCPGHGFTPHALVKESRRRTNGGVVSRHNDQSGLGKASRG